MGRPRVKILLVLPPHSYATRDCAMGYVRALGRVPGVEVEPWHFWPRIMYHDGGVRTWGARQRKAAREAGDIVTRGDYKHGRDLVLTKASMEIVADAIHHDIDWVVVVCGIAFHPDALKLLRKVGIATAAVFTESPYEDKMAHVFGHTVDLLGVNDRTSLARFPAESTIYLPTAYDREIHHPGVEPADDTPDVMALGTGFKERINLLARVDWTGIDLRLRGHWRRGLREPRIAPYIVGENGVAITHNEYSARLYRAARINLNLYRRDGDAQSMSPRAYELAALGTFSLHEDARPEAHEVFGDSVGYFDGPHELADAVRHYLAHPEERERMARESWERVQGQDYDSRAATLLAAMERREREAA